jgi:hypothetical protein
MVDRVLLDRLEKEKIIDRRYVFWWQLGFEGRRIISEEEFNAGLTTVNWDVYDLNEDLERGMVRKNREYRVWTGRDVPILIKTINISGIDISCFITIKPTSHWPPVNLNAKEHIFGPGVYETPHIRGIVAETTDRHIFWYPFYVEDKNEYESLSLRFKNLDYVIIPSPVGINTFYRKFAEGFRRRGKRGQQKATFVEYKRRGFSAVPYFDFDPAQMHITFYPVSFSPHWLDAPVLIASQNTGPKIIGVGYPGVSDRYDFEYIGYWKLNDRERRTAKEVLDTRLGLDLCY